MHHLIVEMIKAQEKVQATHVPYQGSMVALGDLMTGRIDFMFLDAVAAMPQVQAGKVNVVAIAGAKRSRRCRRWRRSPIRTRDHVQAWQSNRRAEGDAVGDRAEAQLRPEPGARQRLTAAPRCRWSASRPTRCRGGAERAESRATRSASATLVRAINLRAN